MSPTDDTTIADLAERRRSTPRWREITIKTSKGSVIAFGLNWADDQRLIAVPADQLINRLVVAGLTHNGDVMPRELLAQMSFKTLTLMVENIDRKLVQLQRNPDIMEMHERPLGGPLVAFEIYLSDERWHDLSLMPWGTALRDADGDARTIRQVLMQCGVSLDGKRMQAWQLAAIEDDEILRLSDAIQQAGREWVDEIKKERADES